MTAVTAQAGINIALIKYWGKRDDYANLPAVGSISLTLDTFTTTTCVEFDDTLAQHEFALNGRRMDDRRVFKLLDELKSIAGRTDFARVASKNTVPTASGLASSASGNAALGLAAWTAAGLSTDALSDNEAFLNLVRKGSGSAPRSLLGGIVELEKKRGTVRQLVDEKDWPICMVVARLSHGPKSVSSRDGMAQSRETSPFYDSWVHHHPHDLDEARRAIERRDLSRLGEVMERSTMRMHACIMASDPPLRYLKGITFEVMDRIEGLRRQGIGAWYTMDAGPHVKILCHEADIQSVCASLRDYVPPNDLRVAYPGSGARVLAS